MNPPSLSFDTPGGKQKLLSWNIEGIFHTLNQSASMSERSFASCSDTVAVNVLSLSFSVATAELYCLAAESLLAMGAFCVCLFCHDISLVFN